MQPKRIEKAFLLLGIGREAKFTLVRNGQEKPAESDQIIVLGTLFLPAEKAEYSRPTLLSSFAFGNRLHLMERPLNPFWGDDSSDGFQQNQKRFVASTWEKAFQEGQEFFNAEISKLVKALKARQEALEAAEEEE